MLGLAETGQMGVEGRDVGIFVAEVDLDLAEVFAAFKQMSCVGVTQGMDMCVLFDAAGLESEAEGALEGGPAHRFGCCGRAIAAVTPGGEEQHGMTMDFPFLAQEQEGAFGQRDVAVALALAAADVEEAPFGIHIADFEAQRLAQTQAAGVNRGQGDTVIQGGHRREDAAHLGSREHDREFELRIGADQLQFVRPETIEAKELRLACGDFRFIVIRRSS